MPRRRKKLAHSDPSLLEMALVGYESAKDTIDLKISEIKKMIGGGRRAISAAVETYTTAKPQKAKRRKMSAAGRKRVAAAQKKRWADAKKAATAAVKTAKKKVKKTAKAVKAKAAEIVPFRFA